ncbi:MAG TPA: thioesterase family protein [Pseudonocardia sp.]
MTSTNVATGFPVVVSRTPRYSDLDPSRRLGRDALLRWFEDARVAVERDAFGADLTTREQWQVKRLLASVRVDVLAPLKVAGRPYRVGLGVTRIGTSSFSYDYAVFDGDDCVATGASTSVHLDDKGPAPLPDAVRAELERLRVDAPEPVREATDPVRLVRENYPFRVDVRARFGDLDTNRHVNNVALAGWYLDALAELHLDVLGYPTGGPLDSLAPSSLHIDYLTEVRYPSIHQLRVGVLDLDTTSVRYACGLFDGPQCIGLAEATGGLSSDEDPELAPRLAAFAFRG